MVKAVFPGTFDPPTCGHIDIVGRAARLFDALYVLVAVNREKKPLLNVVARKSLIENEIAHLGLRGVFVDDSDGLVVDFCRSVGAEVLIRGVRSLSDFDYEFEMAAVNRQLSDPPVETVILPAKPELVIARSSTVRDMVSRGLDVSSMVPPGVEKMIKAAMRRA